MAVGKQWYAPVNGREEAKETGHQLEMAEDTHFQAIRRTSGRAIRLMVGAVIGLLLFGSLFASMLPAGRGVGRSLPRFWTMAAKDDLWGQKLVDWKPPSNLKVVGMVFFGRSRTASVLNCYVQRNLKSNGGLLDEVVWIEGTDEQRELDWLRSIVKETPGYRTWSIPDFVNQEVKAERHYQHAYNIANEEKHPGEVVFVKIDDDIVSSTTLLDASNTYPLSHPGFRRGLCHPRYRPARPFDQCADCKCQRRQLARPGLGSLQSGSRGRLHA